MDRFLEGLQSASKPAPTPRPPLSCQSSHQAKASGGFLLQTLPDIPYSSFQKHPVRKTGTVFPRWHRKACLSLPLSTAGEGREGREGRCQTEISKKKEIKEFPQTRRSIRIQAARRLTAISSIAYTPYFIAYMHRFPCTFCVHFFHNSEFQQIIVVICSFPSCFF